MSATAVVVVDACDDLGQGTSNVHMFADYASEENKGWADATPSLGLSMNVKDSVAQKFFQPGTRLALSFEVIESEEESETDNATD